MKAVIQLCRPKQWVKNVFVLLPLFFSGHLLDAGMVVRTLVAFLSFSLAASSIYCINDVRDAEADRLHPRKCRRPVASGRVSASGALVLAGVLAAGALASGLLLPSPASWHLMAIIAAYLLLNVAYCLRLKRIALVDVSVVSIGFVLRVGAGGVSTGIELSHWIMLMTFLLALFLALSKRRDDVVIYNTTGRKARSNIGRYNLEFLSQANTLVATVTLVCYILYTVSPDVTERFGSNYVYVSSLFVLLGILRYFQITVVDSDSGSPTRIVLTDRFMQACIVCWILTFVVIIYL